MKMNTLLPSFMLFACTFQTIALNSETQNTIIKLEQSVISVGQLITQIENQTDYLVVFKSREVDIERYITVQNTSGKMGCQWEIHLGSSTKSHLANFLHRLPDKRNRYR